MSEALRVGTVTFMAYQKPPKFAQPREKLLDFPASLVSSQLAPVLGAHFAILAVRNNHVHIILC